MLSYPLKVPAALGLGLLIAAPTAGSRHSRMSVLLPEPLTPVTTTKRPMGNLTVMCFRLFAEASLRTRQAVDDECGETREVEAERPFKSTGRRTPRAGNDFLARKHRPVMDSGWRSNSFKVPPATTSPPCTPAPGPRSTM